MLDNTDRLTLMVYNIGLGVPLEGLIAVDTYPRYRHFMARLIASQGDALDVIGEDTRDADRILTTRAGVLLRVIMRHTTAVGEEL